MRVIVFYSFKGGVGRTTALANVAYCLAQRGRKVVVADWDLHAPGLSLMPEFQPPGEGPAEEGLLEYIHSLREANQARMKGEPEPKLKLLADIVRQTRLAEAAQERAGDDEDFPVMRGELLFIPACDVSHGGAAFATAVRAADLAGLASILSTVDEGDRAYLFRRFCDELYMAPLLWAWPESCGQPDYLLVDCRTGVTEIGTLLLSDVADFNVLVYGQDTQNLEGLRFALEKRNKHRPWDLADSTLLLWTLRPAGQEAQRLAQRRRKRDMVKALCLRDRLGHPEPWPDEFEIPYDPEMTLTTEPIAHRYWNSASALLFRQVSDRLEHHCFWVAEEDDGAATDAPWDRQRGAEWTRTQMALGGTLLGQFGDLPDWRWWFPGVPPEAAGTVEDGLLNALIYSPSTPIDVVSAFFDGRVRLDARAQEQLLRHMIAERTSLFMADRTRRWSAMVRVIRSALTVAFARSLTDDTVARERREAVLGGKPVNGWALSESPIFPLLIAEILDTVLYTDDPRSDDKHAARTGAATLTRSPPTLNERAGLDERAAAELRYQLMFGVVERWGAPDSVIPAYAAERLGVLCLVEGHGKAETVGWARLVTQTVEALGRPPTPQPDRPDGLGVTDLTSVVGGRPIVKEMRIEWVERAIDAFQRLCNLRPDHPATLCALGNALLERRLASPETEQAAQTELVERAVKSFERSLTLWPDDPGALRDLGRALRIWSRFSPEPASLELLGRATQAGERSVSLRPDDPIAMNSYGGNLLARGRVSPDAERADWFNKALDILTRCMTLAPSIARYNYACALVQTGKCEDGLDALELHLSQSPDKRDWAANDPDFEAVRLDPRYRALVGLPKDAAHG